MHKDVEGTDGVVRPISAIVGTSSAHRRNAALAALSPAAFSSLEPHLRRRDFQEGSVLWDAGEQVDRIYFPLSGIVSIVLPVKDGNGVEVASIGREAIAGTCYRWGTVGPSLSWPTVRGIVQIGGEFFIMSAMQFANIAWMSDEVERLAGLSCDWLLTQSQQMAACNAVHLADARLCRWLLLSAERLEGDLIPATQETIARALGIRRTTVTVIAHDLQIAGIITYKRGKIVIRDYDRLRAAACDCHAALDRSYWPSERLSAG